MNALTMTDFYKVGHFRQYPEGTTLVFSNLTARAPLKGVGGGAVFFGLQYYVERYLIEEWNHTFFEVPRDEAVTDYARRLRLAGLETDMAHIEALHDLGFLPLAIHALPEGTLVPYGVPMLVLWNTDPRFAWVTNYIETSLSATLWGPITSATTARLLKRTFKNHLCASGGDESFAQWMGHDFSYRGMFGNEAAAMSGAGHLLFFTGTDTIPAIDFLEQYYGANADLELIGASVPATEHSVMSAGGQAGEVETFARLLDLYPSGIVSIVSDTWDYWRVLTGVLPALKDRIMARDGKLVVRPDSGDPVKIICGDPDAPAESPEGLGTFEVLWRLFGGTVNSMGYRTLDSHIGAIYGDGITPERAKLICALLVSQGFVPTMVFGIGSLTYQYQTRDVHGLAMKATYVEVNGKGREIFKSPKTKGGVVKDSARGLLAVNEAPGGGLALKQSAAWDDVLDCDLKPVFVDGQLVRHERLAEIRARAEASCVPIPFLASVAVPETLTAQAWS